MNANGEGPRRESRNWQINFRAFLWHAAFLSLATSFMDVSTVVSSMVIKAGGTAVHLGFMTAIMLGGASLFQLVFAGLVSGKPHKKKYLLWGINSRVASLLCLALVFFESPHLSGNTIIAAIFLLLSVFAVSGAFANVAYVDVLGKAILSDSRKRFFSLKQVLGSFGVLASAVAARDLLTRQAYPLNYALVFLMAGLILLTASAGFWRIREPAGVAAPRKSPLRFLAMIPAEIKSNRNLKYYLLTINSLGLGLSIVPFTILFAKVRFGLDYRMIGNFLLLSTIGSLVTGLILFRLSRRLVYRRVLAFSLVTGGLIPLSCILLSDHPTAYQLILVLAGVFLASYKVAIGGILLEISTDENRAFYTGVSGAANIMTALFPIAAGWLIPAVGFQAIFSVVMAIILMSYLFTSKLRCEKPQSSSP